MKFGFRVSSLRKCIAPGDGGLWPFRHVALPNTSNSN
jgi:hypothetical protein